MINNYQSFQVGQTFVVKWTKPTEAATNELEKNLESLHKEIGRFFLVIIIPDRSAMPDKDAQVEMTQYATHLEKICKGITIVIEGDPFGSGVRKEFVKRQGDVSKVTIVSSIEELFETFPKSNLEELKAAYKKMA